MLASSLPECCLPDGRAKRSAASDESKDDWHGHVRSRRSNARSVAVAAVLDTPRRHARVETMTPKAAVAKSPASRAQSSAQRWKRDCSLCEGGEAKVGVTAPAALCTSTLQ